MGSNDWAMAIKLVNILKPIKESTKKLEGRPNENSPARIANVYPILKVILTNFEKLKVQYAGAANDTPF